MSEFVNNKNADFTKDLPEPKEAIELKIEPNTNPTPPIKHKSNPLITSQPIKTDEDMPLPNVDEQIFQMPKQEEIKKPVKKKRQLSERQLAHLARMREKSLQKRRAKKQQKELERQQKLKEKELKKVKATPVLKPSQSPMENIPEEIKKTAKKKGQSVEEFFGNVKLFMDTMEQYQRLKKPQPSKPIQIPKKNIQRPTVPKPKPYVAPTPKPVYQDVYSVNLNMINKNNFRNPFGF